MITQLKSVFPRYPKALIKSLGGTCWNEKMKQATGKIVKETQGKATVVLNSGEKINYELVANCWKRTGVDKFGRTVQETYMPDSIRTVSELHKYLPDYTEIALKSGKIKVIDRRYEPYFVGIRQK